MPRNTPKATNELSRYTDGVWWQGWEEFEDHGNAKEFAQLCRQNKMKARAIKLPESRQWHGSLSRTVIYVPRDLPHDHKKQYWNLLCSFLEERNLARP